MAVRAEQKSYAGSISPLIMGYFLILMSMIFLASNVISIYSERRELIAMTESALFRASHELDEQSYYLDMTRNTWNILNGRKPRVPIDCLAASRIFRNELEIERSEKRQSAAKILGDASEVQLAGVQSSDPRIDSIDVVNFNCDGEQISAQVRRVSELPFQLRVFELTTFTNEIEAAVISEYVG